jgi:HK97 family phage prohead protease
MFFNHSHWDLPIGKWDEMSVDETGLYMKGKLNLNLDEGRDVYEAVKFGSVDGLSIGFRMDENGATYDDDGVRHIHNVKELLEVSVVTFPADKNARISDVKSTLETLDNVKEFERFLRDAGGFSRSEALALCAKARKIFNPQASELPKEEDINLDPAVAAMRKLNSVLKGK